tara:strand:+ start:1019 stop:1876 length:858 start_codon:yes stop_codon:yes gene_type:complete
MFKKIFKKLIFIQIFLVNFACLEELKAIIPFYDLPNEDIFRKNSYAIAKNAYQLLYYGQLQEGLNLAKLAISLNKKDSKLWGLLAEAQIANKLYDDALFSIRNGININPKMSELYFTKSSIFIKQNKIKDAKNSLKKGLNLNPDNINAMFQLGNLYLIEKKLEKSLDSFNNITNSKPDFWQAFNNKGLIYFELNNIPLAIKNFKKAISIEENAEPLLALAVCIQNENFKESVLLAKKALSKNPNYVDLQYRKEQLWGKKIQKQTNKLLSSKELKQEVAIAKLFKK